MTFYILSAPPMRMSLQKSKGPTKYSSSFAIKFLFFEQLLFAKLNVEVSSVLRSIFQSHGLLSVPFYIQIFKFHNIVVRTSQTQKHLTTQQGRCHRVQDSMTTPNSSRSRPCFILVVPCQLTLASMRLNLSLS